jgi:hypothetical protein
MIKKKIVFLFFVSISLYTFPSYAGEYKLVKGKEYSLCRDLLSNLKSLGSPRMTCENKFHPKFKQFQKIPWEKVNPVDYKIAIKENFFEANSLKGYENKHTRKFLKEQYLLERDDYSPSQLKELHWGKYWQHILTLHQQGKPVVQHSRVDMGGIDDKENILLIRNDDCKEIKYILSPPDPSVIVLEDNNIHLDRRYLRLMKAYSQNIFFYQGKARLSKWSSGFKPILFGEKSIPIELLNIYDVSFSSHFGGGRDHVCEFYYK